MVCGAVGGAVGSGWSGGQCVERWAVVGAVGSGWSGGQCVERWPVASGWECVGWRIEESGGRVLWHVGALVSVKQGARVGDCKRVKSG